MKKKINYTHPNPLPFPILPEQSIFSKPDISNPEITIEYESTIATAQFENVKPKIIMKTTFDNAEKMLEKCRSLLRQEYIKIKGGKND